MARDVSGLEPGTHGDTEAEHVQWSIAISLRRIADELTGTDKRLGVVDSIFEAIARTQNR